MGEQWEDKLQRVLEAVGSMIRDEYRRIPVLQRDLPRLRCLVDVLASAPLDSETPSVIRSYLVTPDISREANPRPAWSRATNGGYYSTARATVAPEGEALILRLEMKPGEIREIRF